MKLLRTVLAFSLCMPLAAVGCSPAFEQAHDPSREAQEHEEVLPTEPPSVRVVQISRGRPAKRGESTCVETASITLAVKDDSPSLPFAYTFRKVVGELPDAIFPSGLYVGSSNGEGERIFVFYWPDLSNKPAPFSAEIEVRAHSRRGSPGPVTVLVVRDGI
jgi:hypothetical protein